MKKYDNDLIYQIVYKALKNGTLRYSQHAHERMRERNITVSDVKDVIIYGKREEGLDELDKSKKFWRYSIRNSNVDGRDLSISLDIEDHPTAVIVTVMQVDPNTARYL